MKVCFITGEYPPLQGGIADYTRELALALRRRGVEVAVLTSARAQPAAAEDAAAGIRVLPLVRDWGFRFWLPAQRILEQTGANIAHIQYQPAAFGLQPAVNLLPWWLHWRWTGRGGARRVVTTMHDLRGPYIFPKAGPLREWATRFLVRSSDAAIFTNEEDLAICAGARWSGSWIPLAHNIPVAPPPDFARETWRERLGVGPAEALVGYFGFVNRSKGLDVLLAALRLLREQGRAARLLVVGGSAGDADVTNVAYRAAVLRTIADLGLAEAVIWTGHVRPAEVSAHLLATDVVALPYLDGASFRRTTLLAALAHGRPVVTTEPRYQGNQGPLLRDGENCRLVAVGDAAGLADALAGLLDRPAAAERLGSAGRALAQTFTWEGVAAQTHQVYQALIGPALADSGGGT